MDRSDDGGGAAMTRWAEAPERREQLVLFAQRLDDALPPEHSVRLLDEILAQMDWSTWEAKYHLHLGQPAIHPRVLASVLLYGLLTRIRASRGLEDALQVRMDFRWLAEGRCIDHTTLSEFRRKHADELKELFVQVVQLARRLELVSLERLGFDATRVRANNRRTGTRTPEELRKERDELAAKFDEHAKQAAAEDVRDEELFDSGSTHQVPAVEEVQRQFGLESPPEVLTDGLNCTGANLTACAERGISIVSPCDVPDPASNPALRADPTQPVPEADWDRLPVHPIKGRQPQIDKSAFVYDEERDCYWCPMGQPLTYRTTCSEAGGSGRRLRSRYQAEQSGCAACPLRTRCVQNTKPRTINREQHEAHRERHARKMATPEAQATYALRRHPGERPFAVIKHQFGLRRFLLRGLAQVRTEWRWAATAFNLQRLMSLIWSRAGPQPSLIAINP
jgi:transposase